MSDFWQQYVIQTREEIDTEKQQRDSLLNFAIAVTGALGYGILQVGDLNRLLSHPAAKGIAVSLLVVITSLFWVRRKKLQQIADRWFVLGHIAKQHADDFPSCSMESVVCPNLTKRTYVIKDTVLALALSLPIYVLILFTTTKCDFWCLVVPVHATATIGILFRGLKDRTGTGMPHAESLAGTGKTEG